MGRNLSCRQRCGKVSFGYEGSLTFLFRESKNGMCPITAECVLHTRFKITSSNVYYCHFSNVMRTPSMIFMARTSLTRSFSLFVCPQGGGGTPDTIRAPPPGNDQTGRTPVFDSLHRRQYASCGLCYETLIT